MLRYIWFSLGLTLIAIIVLGTYSYRTLVGTRTDIAEPKNLLESVLPEDRELEVVRPEASVSLSQLKNNILTPLSELKSLIITPPPLNLLSAAGVLDSTPTLSRAGVIAWTNVARIDKSLPPLQENSKLNEIARLRLEDMFNKQYFAHASPSGLGVSDVAGQIDYKFIVIGENLALGTFNNDQAVVKAWLDSPAHQANIEAKRYTDIGVAVQEGIFEGRRARLAVQVFGTPFDLCPEPNQALKAQIFKNKARLDSLERQLTDLKLIVEGETVTAVEEFKQIRQFNTYASEFNNLLQITQASIVEYNNQVARFNRCAGL